jgi:hypothetical protein
MTTPAPVRFVYLRRKNKKDGTLHPFAAIGLVYHRGAKQIRIARTSLHSSDKHFSKEKARKLLIQKVYRDPIVSESPFSNAPELSKFISENVWGRVTDKDNTRRIYESVYNDAVEDSKDLSCILDERDNHEHGCAP